MLICMCIYIYYTKSCPVKRPRCGSNGWKMHQPIWSSGIAWDHWISSCRLGPGSLQHHPMKAGVVPGEGRFHNTIHMMEWIKLHQVNLNIEIQCQVPFSCWCAWVQRIHHGKHQSHIRHTSYVHLPERVFSSPYNIINIYNNQFEHNQCSWNRWNTKGFGGPTMGTYTN